MCGHPLIAQFRPPSMAGSNRGSVLLAIPGPAPSPRRDQRVAAHALAAQGETLGLLDVGDILVAANVTGKVQDGHVGEIELQSSRA